MQKWETVRGGAEASFMSKAGNGTWGVQFTYRATWDLTCKQTCCHVLSICFKNLVINVICNISLKSTRNIPCFGKDKVIFLYFFCQCSGNEFSAVHHQVLNTLVIGCELNLFQWDLEPPLCKRRDFFCRSWGVAGVRWKERNTALPSQSKWPWGSHHRNLDLKILSTSCSLWEQRVQSWQCWAAFKTKPILVSARNLCEKREPHRKPNLASNRISWSVGKVILITWGWEGFLLPRVPVCTHIVRFLGIQLLPMPSTSTSCGLLPNPGHLCVLPGWQ